MIACISSSQRYCGESVVRDANFAPTAAQWGDFVRFASVDEQVLIEPIVAPRGIDVRTTQVGDSTPQLSSSERLGARAEIAMLIVYLPSSPRISITAGRLST